MSVKNDRIESNIIKEISYILANEIKDKDISFVTITACKLASDLSSAKIYFTVLNDSVKETTIALNNASRYIRKCLADRIDVRHTPELIFIYDESIEYGKKIEDIIDRISEQ